jgi:hypothetical protein
MAKIKMSSRLKQLMSELFEKLARQNSLKEGALEGMTFGDQIQTDTDGVIPNSRVLMSTNASNNDTLTIGGHVIKFVTSLASAYTFTQVKIGGDAATTRARSSSIAPWFWEVGGTINAVLISPSSSIS